MLLTYEIIMELSNAFKCGDAVMLIRWGVKVDGLFYIWIYLQVAGTTVIPH